MLRETRTGSQDDGGFAQPRRNRYIHNFLRWCHISSDVYFICHERPRPQTNLTTIHKLSERSKMVKFLAIPALAMQSESDIGVPRSSPSASPPPRRKFGTNMEAMILRSARHSYTSCQGFSIQGNRARSSKTNSTMKHRVIELISNHDF